MMNIDKDNLPAEVFHVSIAALRKGVGIRRGRPTAHKFDYSGIPVIAVAGLKGWVPVEDCYPTREAALEAAREQIATERRQINLKHEMAISALTLAEKALS